MAEWEEIYRIANRLAPAMRAEFLAAVEQLSKRLTLATLADAVASGGFGQIELEVAKFPADLQPAVRVVNETFMRAGAKAAEQMSTQLSFTLRFDSVNDAAVDAARQQAARLVTNITDATQAGIRTVIVRAFQEGIAPREAARLIQPMIGLTMPQTNVVLQYRRELLGGGMPATRTRALVERMVDRFRRDRSLTIARFETLEAANLGQLRLWQQAQDEGLLSKRATKELIITRDEKLCRRCRAVRPRVIPLNKSWTFGTTSKSHPPFHPRCRCTMGIRRP